MSVGAFFDVDGTLVHGNVAALAAWDWVKRGFIPPARFMRGVARFWGSSLLGRLDYGELTRVGFTMLAGKPADAIQAEARDILERRIRGRIYEQALERIRWHQAEGHRVALVSSAPAPMVRALAEFVGAQDVIVSELESREGILTGRVSGELCYGEGKRRLTGTFAQRQGISLADSFAYADGYPDVPFLAAVGHPAAVNPDRKLRREAVRRGWKIVRFSGKERTWA